MSKRPRRMTTPAAVRPGHAVATDPAQQPTRQLQKITLTVHPSPVRLDPAAVIEIVAPTDPAATVILLREETGAWRAALLPPGSAWELKAKGPALWRPGMPN